MSRHPFLPFFDHSPAAPKICGVTHPDDAYGIIEAGAGAIGFNFYPPSPRCLSPDDGLDWIRDLGEVFPDIARVAVVVNPDEALLTRLRSARCFDAIQFHGDETPESCRSAAEGFGRWIKALRVRSASDLTGVEEFDTPFLLLDAAVPGSYGGSGETIDWGIAAKFVVDHPDRRLILAGGLTPANVSEAVRAVRPHAVDVASGVESAPGVKDAMLVRGFIHAALDEN